MKFSVAVERMTFGGVKRVMKRSSVTVVWKEGLHMRPAAKLVQSAQRFRSTVTVRFKNQVANARSILAVMMLCAAMGAVLEVEVAGDDEDAALAAVEAVFAGDNAPDDSSRA